MSFTTGIVKTVTGSLRLVALRIKFKQDVKVSETKIAELRDPRFTKDQFENLSVRTPNVQVQPDRRSLSPLFNSEMQRHPHGPS